MKGLLFLLLIAVTFFYAEPALGKTTEIIDANICRHVDNGPTIIWQQGYRVEVYQYKTDRTPSSYAIIDIEGRKWEFRISTFNENYVCKRINYNTVDNTIVYPQ